jgi:hypothetical protein
MIKLAYQFSTCQAHGFTGNPCQASSVAEFINHSRSGQQEDPGILCRLGKKGKAQ